MGNSQSSNTNKINFEDIKYAIKNNTYLLISTLTLNEQNCLIINTINASDEENIINNIILSGNKNKINIILYGKNANDELVYKKYNQFLQLGFANIYIYTGGLFEWLLLQDIYGKEEFPTTTDELDILKYKSNKMLDIQFITY